MQGLWGVRAACLGVGAPTGGSKGSSSGSSGSGSNCGGAPPPRVSYPLQAGVASGDRLMIRGICGDLLALIASKQKDVVALCDSFSTHSSHLSLLTQEFVLQVTHLLIIFDCLSHSGARDREAARVHFLTLLRALRDVEPARIAAVEVAMSLAPPGRALCAWLQVCSPWVSGSACMRSPAPSYSVLAWVTLLGSQSNHLEMLERIALRVLSELDSADSASTEDGARSGNYKVLLTHLHV